MKDEIAFLLNRTMHGPNHGDVGRSSEALVLAAFTGETVSIDHYPLDTADLGRCLRTFAAAPASLRNKMRVNLAAYLRHIADGVEKK